ncbi:MAG: hypothetical protein ACI9GE_001039, partial [Oceanospirillaceae bacterium]
MINSNLPTLKALGPCTLIVEKVAQGAPIVMEQ